MSSAFSGGDALMDKLKALSQRVGDGAELKVGFLEGATYEDGTPVATIAALNEFGGTLKIPERQQDLHFRLNEKTGNIKPRFVKRSKSNFAQTVTIPAHTVTVPPRPFFRNMIAIEGPTWGKQMVKLMKANDNNATTAISQLGEHMASKLRQSIRNTTSPGLSQSTLRRGGRKRKPGVDRPLIDTGHMINSVDYEVNE